MAVLYTTLRWSHETDADLFTLHLNGSGLNSASEDSTNCSITAVQSRLVYPPATADPDEDNFTLADPEPDGYQGFYHMAQMITGLVFYPTFCIFGLTGNILSIIVLRGRKTQSPTNSFLIALSVSDGIKLLNDLFYFVVILLLHTDPTKGERLLCVLYPYAHYFFNMSICITAWITVTLAAERYILVCHATRAKQMCNMKRAHVTITMVFVAMTVLAIPSALRYKTVYIYGQNSSDYNITIKLTDLWKDESFVTAYTWTQNMLRSLVPLAILCTLNYFIVQALRGGRRQNRPSSHRKMTHRHRVTVMLVSVIVVFIVCVTPDAIMSTVFGFGYYESSNLVRGVREITDLLLTVNSATNFVLYCVFNNVFRHRFRMLVVGGCSCRGQRERPVGEPQVPGMTYFLQSSMDRRSPRSDGDSKDDERTAKRAKRPIENVAQTLFVSRRPIRTRHSVTWTEEPSGIDSKFTDGGISGRVRHLPNSN